MTPQERKVFEQALEALEREARGYAVHDELQIPRSMRDAITAIKEVLAQPEQIPPSAYSNTHQPEPVMHTLNCVCGAVWDIKTDGSEEMVHTPYTTPPPRKPLTDEQKMALCKQFPNHLTFNAIHAIEASHGIKE